LLRDGRLRLLRRPLGVEHGGQEAGAARRAYLASERVGAGKDCRLVSVHVERDTRPLDAARARVRAKWQPG